LLRLLYIDETEPQPLDVGYLSHLGGLISSLTAINLVQEDSMIRPHYQRFNPDFEDENVVGPGLLSTTYKTESSWLILLYPGGWWGGGGNGIR